MTDMLEQLRKASGVRVLKDEEAFTWREADRGHYRQKELH